VELLAFDGGTLEHRALVGRDAVQPRRQQGLNRRRDGDVAVSVLGDHRQHLLDEERVSVRGGCDAPWSLSRLR
jgi:hypothetical protein